MKPLLMKSRLTLMLSLALALLAVNADATETKVALQPLHAIGERLVSVPQRAVVYRNGIPGVFVAQNGEARFRMVRLGKQTGKTVAVLSGLFGDETLVLTKPEQLYDGMPLKLDSNTDRNLTTP